MATMLSGDLTLSRIPALLSQAPVLAANAVLDLAAVERTDSAGLAFLIELSRQAQQRGGALQFRNAPAQMQQLAQFFGVDAVLRLNPAT